MTRDEARQWLDERGLRPVPTSLQLGENTEGRWYPYDGSNVDSKFFEGIKHCLLPPEVHRRLVYQTPDSWDSDNPYPWFRPLNAAIEAAIDAVIACERNGELK